jgi:hypothetical protein
MQVVNTTSTTDPVNMYNNMNTFISTPIVLIIVFMIIVVYFIFFSSLGNNSENNSFSSSSSNTSKIPKIIGIIIAIILIIIIIKKGFQYFFNTTITAYISGLFTTKPKLEIDVNHGNYQPSSSFGFKFNKQVFNIPGNYYNYVNAKALCSAYGSRLATYQEVEKTYNEGGEWCNYGWSDGQMALFPTQQKTYDYLQKEKGHENDCGRPGINGGFIENPKVRFGVNCFGKKPPITSEEKEIMETTPPYPESAQDIAFQKRVDYWKTKINEILVSPFNKSEWS